MNMHAIRLREGQELKQAIIDFVKTRRFSAAVIVSAVGSLSHVSLRMAGARPERQDIREYKGDFEIVSLVGTMTAEGGAHLHISISDAHAIVTGGHFKSGTVHTTVELAIADEAALQFTREIDGHTGFDELTVQERP